MIDLKKLRESEGYMLAIVNTQTGEYEPVSEELQVVRHGKWLYGESESGHDGYYCSQCGEHIRWRYGEEDIDFIRSYNYCPNCGEKMDGNLLKGDTNE